MAGLLPPPVHGQSVATAALFSADLSPVEPVFLPIRYSHEVNEIGRPSLRKIGHLFRLVGQCWRLWLKERPRVLYYTPGSASVVPFARDIVFLLLCRPLFKVVVLHYHAGGLPDFLAKGWRRVFGRRIYGRGAWAVGLSHHVEVPGKRFGAKREFVVPNGVDVPLTSPTHSENGTFRLLFLGNLFEDKGVFDLIDAAFRLAAQVPMPVELTLIGASADEETDLRLKGCKKAAPANLAIQLPGPKNGDEKWAAYAGADVFVFPSFYRSENLPLVLIEAMAFGLPVISTRWRGSPDLVGHGENGLLVEPRNVVELADAMQRLALDPALVQRMGACSRGRYETEFTVGSHVKAMKTVLIEALDAAYS